MSGGSGAGDPRFFARTGPHSLIAVAEAAGCPAPDGDRLLHGIAPLQTAGPDEVSFLDNRKYAAELSKTRAGAVIVAADQRASVPEGCVAIVSPNPYESWARVAALFHPTPPARPGTHASAVVDPTAMVHPDAEIGPLAVIGAHAVIAAGCRIGPHAVIGDAVQMGPDCRIGAHASLSHAVLGARVYVYPGARIGQDGFGFAVTARGLLTVPQVGRVVLEDDVEIGANSTVDRGSLHDTVIGAGSRLDNLVQIAHNVRLGRGCVLVSQVGISGSTILEDQVMLGGQAGLIGHLRVGRGAKIGAQAGVMGDVAAGADVLGSPALPGREWLRIIAAMRRMGRPKDLGPGAGETTGTDTN